MCSSDLARADAPKRRKGLALLEKILRRLVDDAMTRASLSGAEVDVVALAAVRATREAIIEHDGESLPAILGTPLPGETMNGEELDPNAEFALFPGDLPEDPESIFEPAPAPPSPTASATGKSDSRSTASPASETRYGKESSLEPTPPSDGKDSHFRDLAFVRFRPPRLERTAEGLTLSLPHVRLDRTLQFLLGDRLT